MSKSVLNQRYCYKINSDYIRRNKGNVEIKNIRKAIKNRFIVGMGDSGSTRNIRDIISSKYDEEYIDNIKKEIRSIKKVIMMATNKDELRNKLKELNNELLKATLQDKVCNVVFKTDNDYNKYSKEGFKLNGNNNGVFSNLFLHGNLLCKCAIEFGTTDSQAFTLNNTEIRFFRYGIYTEK